MTLGISLALIAALAHAAWNTIVKQVSAGGTAALWAYTLGSFAFVAVVGLVAVGIGYDVHVDARLVLVAVGSTFLHTAYAALTQAAYKHFDLSQTYPVTRGLAPVTVAFTAALLLHQRLSAWQWVGVVSMAAALACLLADGAGVRGTFTRGPLTWGIVIALTIAAYTTYDGWAIVNLHVQPLAYYAVGTAAQLLLVTALMRGDIPEGLAQFRRHLPPVAALALLIPASYVLALYATQRAPVSVVAAIRASSLLWAALAAAVALKEPLHRGRLAATGLVMVAVVAMAA